MGYRPDALRAMAARYRPGQMRSAVMDIDHEADHRPVRRESAVEPVPSAGGIACDQAIFTSVRSPTGEGYRIIASSGGLSQDERTEITRRCPSHGNLCAAGPDVAGLLSFAVPNGRRCVALCRHAGSEHTARGGQRVYTHAVFLDAEAYTQFGSNPLPIYAMLVERYESEGPLLQPDPRLPRLTLSPPAISHDILPSTPRQVDSVHPWSAALAGAMLESRPMVIAGVGQPWTLLRQAWACVPRYLRAGLDVSVGVKYSPARRLSYVLLPDDDAQARRMVSGPVMLYQSADQEPAAQDGPAASWVHCLLGWWRGGMAGVVEHLTGQVVARAQLSDLPRFVQICEDYDAARRADDLAHWRDLSDRWSAHDPVCESEADLIGFLRRQMPTA